MALPNTTTTAPSTVEQTPGNEKTTMKKLLEIGSNMIQSFKPLSNVNTHLCGFAFYANDPSRQMELHHYCAAINDDVIQCMVYDSDEATARLIGIEYVVSGRIFETLPPEEQKLWHNHTVDVHTASFIAPGLPDAAEKRLLTDLADTYGKTFVLWQVDRGDKLPIGLPQLMMVATKESEWNPKIFQTRDARMGHDTEKHKKNVLADIPKPPIRGNADGGYRERLSLQLVSNASHPHA